MTAKEYEELIEKVNMLIPENEWHKTQWKSSRSFRECHNRLKEFLTDLLNKHLEQEEHLREHDEHLQEHDEHLKEHDDLIEEILGLIDELEKVDDEHEKLISDLQKEDSSILNKIEMILQYYDQNEDGETLSHKYDSFPLLYNDNYVAHCVPKIKVDPLAGVVHYDLRLLMKVDVPADDDIIIAKCPASYMPVLSAPCAWLVRDSYISEADGLYEAEGYPTLTDGKAVFSFTNNDVYGRVRIRAKEVIRKKQFLYLNGTYFLKPSAVGKFNLDKSLEESETYKLNENLLGRDSAVW